jgi:hypothetical protein
MTNVSAQKPGRTTYDAIITCVFRPNRPRIPEETGHFLRGKSATRYEGVRPGNPQEGGVVCYDGVRPPEYGEGNQDVLAPLGV